MVLLIVFGDGSSVLRSVPEKYTAIIERVDFPNKGIAYVEDKTCVIKNTIPGQEVEFMVSKKRGDRMEGRLLSTIKKAPNEVDSPCPHFGICGSCVYLNLSYKEQLELKKGQVNRLLTEALKNQDEPWEFEGVKESPRPLEYRNKMEFSFGDAYKDGPLTLGMHKRGSAFDVERVSECRIVDDDFRKILNITCDYFKALPFFHRMSHEGYLRHLLVRKAVKTGEILVGLVTSSQTPENVDDMFIKGWVNQLLNIDLVEDSYAQGKITGVLHITNDSLADVVTADKVEVLYGDEFIHEELLGLKFKISTFSFFQTNSLGAEVLYSAARDYIGDLTENGEKTKIVFDLYSGTGTIAQMLAPVAKKVIGVEIVPEAVAAAKENAKLNGLDNCEFIADDVLNALDNIKDRPDFIVLDPPRAGVNPKALKKIIDYGVDNLIYISCKITSLCTDLEMLLLAGYRVKKVVCVDMFPATGNIETVVLLSQLRHKPDDYIDVDVDVAELEGTSAETKATYEKIKKYVAEHNDGMKVSNLYIAQVKRKCGLELAENFNLPKSEDSRQPQCPKEKEEAIVEALKAFQMV